MSLKDEILKHPSNGNRHCHAGAIIQSLTDEDREALDTVLPRIGQEPGYTTVWLLKILKNEGFTIGENTLRRHLRGECICR